MESLIVRAEQALLGAVLLDPAGQRDVLGLVEPDDMFRPWHGQVLAAMRRAEAAGVLPGPAEVYAELQRDPDLPGTVARDAVLLAELMEAAPRAEHAEAYAAFVVEGTIRRRLELSGCRLAQAAETAQVDAALHQVQAARREVAACRARWLALPAPPGRDVIPLRRGERGRDGASPAAAVRDQERRAAHTARARENTNAADQGADVASRTGDAPSGDAEAAGTRALRDLIAGPGQIAQVRGWLRPEHFTVAGHGQVYAAIADLDAAGRPVDPVTVAWEAARRGVRADPAALAGGAGAFATASAGEVCRLGWCAQAAQAGRDIQAGAAGPRFPPRQLMSFASERLHALAPSPHGEAARGREPRTGVGAVPAQAARARAAEPEAAR